MGNSSPKKAKKTSRQKNQKQRVVKRVIKKTEKKSQKGSWLSSLLTIAILLGTTSLVVTFAWISFLFIFNPQQVAWINKLLPGWVQNTSKGEAPQPLEVIKAAITKQGNIAGETLTLDNATNALLMPVYKVRPNCQTDCQEIIELRVYQLATDLEFKSETQKYYQLTTQITIAGPEESFIIAPLVNNTDTTPGTSIALPVTEIKKFDGTSPSPGVWLYLRGQRQEGTYNLTYGHILYYNSQRSHLQQMMSWTSPKGELPHWQQITGSNAKELVINQTVGLEPLLRVYQVKSVKTFLNPVELEEIVLKPSAFNNSAYEKALVIARSGLWSPAFEWLQSIQKQNKKLPASALAQIEIIKLHSQLTKTQADTNWASPGQQILVNLIDGRWEKALQVFKGASPQNAKEIGTLLKSDSGRLWSRVEAALQVNANRFEAQAWGALILAAQKGDGAAYAWLKQEFKDKVNLADIQGLLKQLKGEVIAQQVANPTLTSRIIGSAQNISKFNPQEWLQPQPNGDLNNSSQPWYQIEVSTFNDGKNWLKTPFNSISLPKTAPETFLWSKLGLNTDSTIQIAIWSSSGEQQTTTATVKAVQLKNGVLRLLATSADPMNLSNSNSKRPQALAISASALEWVQPSAITLEELKRQDALKGDIILPAVWRVLQASNQVPKGAIPSIQQLQQKLGHWPIQEIDLTSNGKPEIVLTVSADAIASLNSSNSQKQQLPKNKSRSYTVIFSDKASIIYTDYGNNSEQSLTAIANLAQTASPSLLIENAGSYSMKRWSEKNQRFE